METRPIPPAQPAPIETQPAPVPVKATEQTKPVQKPYFDDWAII